MPSSPNNLVSRGFTLIEMLIIAPLVILFIGVMILTITTVTGESLQTSARNTMAYEVQDALDLIETEASRSATYPTTTGTLTSPQGSNGSTAAFTVTGNDASPTDNDVLIIKTPATTTNPLNNSKDLIYYNSPNDCSSSNVSENDYYPITTVYFVSGGSLWQRTILPSSGTPCSTPWQRNSCATTAAISGVCQTHDNKLVSDVTSFSVQYLKANGTPLASTNSSTAKSVNISISSSKSVAGRTISYNGSTRSVALNGGSTAAPVSSIATSVNHTCAIITKNPYCWGSNGNWGKLGNGSLTGSSNIPAPVVTSGSLSGKTVTDISIAPNYSCAVASSKAYCWGNGAYGGTGNGGAGITTTPTPVIDSGALNGKTVKNISAGYEHTCVVASNNAYCWGQGGSGQLGNLSNNSNQYSPVAVDTSGVLNGKTVTNISAGVAPVGPHTCAIASGKAYCWGGNDYYQLGVSGWITLGQPYAVTESGVLSGRTITDISAGAYHSCAVADGKAYCWGSDANGELGSSSASGSQNLPVAVDTSGVLNGKTVTDISAGNGYTCAVADGKAYCWGNNSEGRLGDNSTTLRSTPVAVDTSGVMSGEIITSISARSGDTTCATSTTGAYCWGRGTSGTLGNGTAASSLVPLSVTLP